MNVVITPSRVVLTSFLSGAGALIYQVVWQRVLAQEIGVDLLSTKVTIIVFLLGLALGYRAGNALASRGTRFTQRFFCVTEVAIGLFGLFSVPLIRSIRTLELSSLPYIDLAVCSFLLLIPTFFMGLSTPLLVSFSKSLSERNGEWIGKLYGANVLGAALGALVSGLLLIETFGIQATCLFAVAANFCAGSLVGMSRHPNPTTASPTANGDFQLPIPIVLASILLGFASLGFEMVSFRSIFLFFGLASYNFPIVLGIFLLAMASGEWLGGKLSLRNRWLRLFSPNQLLLLLTGLALAASFVVSRFAPVEVGSGAISGMKLVHLIFLSLIFMSPIVFISGFFPILVNQLVTRKEELAACTASLLFLFTIANVVGGLTTSFLLLPHMGTPLTLFAVLCLIVIAIVLIEPKKGVMVTSVISVLVVLFFFRDFRKSSEGKQLKVIEDALGIYEVTDEGADEVAIRIFRTPTAGAFKKNSLIFESFVPDWSMANLAMTSEFQPKNALIVGLGNGMLAYGLAQYPSMQHITIIELLPTITKLVLEQTHPKVREVLESPLVNIVTGDGRRFLQREAKNRQFDVIQIGVFHTWASGASNIYTKEFFSNLKNHLSPKGVLIVHNYYSLVDTTALAVFEYGYSVVTHVAKRFHFFASKPIEFVAQNRNDKVHSDFCRISEASRPTAEIYQLRSPQQTYLNTDDTPLLEYYTLREIIFRTTGYLMKKELSMATQKEKIAEFTIPCPNPGEPNSFSSALFNPR